MRKLRFLSLSLLVVTSACAELSPLWTGITPRFDSLSVVDPVDPSVAVSVSINHRPERYFTPSRAARRFKALTAQINTKPNDAGALATRAQVWDGLTEVFLESDRFFGYTEARQYGYQWAKKWFDPEKRELVYIPDGYFDPFEALRDRDVRAAFAAAPNASATLAAIVQMRALSDFAPPEYGGASLRVATALELLGILEKTGHPEAARERALMAAKISVVHSLRAHYSAPAKLSEFEALAMPLLDQAVPSPLEGDPTALSELAIWRLAAKDCLLRLALDNPAAVAARAANDAQIALAVQRMPGLMGEVAIDVWRAMPSNMNPEIRKKWLGIAEQSIRRRPSDKLRLALALELPAHSDERFAVLAELAFSVAQIDQNAVAFLLELSDEATRRAQPDLARRALAVALDEGAPYTHWQDLARMEYEADDFTSAYLANQVALQVRLKGSGSYDPELDRSPRGELSRWLEMRNALLLDLLQKSKPLAAEDYEAAKSKKSVVSKSPFNAGPQSIALFAALNNAKTLPSDTAAVMKAAATEFTKYLPKNPTNTLLRLDCIRLQLGEP